MSILPLAASADVVALADHVWAGPGWDVALHALSDGGRRVARSRCEAGVRDLWHYEWAAGRLRALDHTVFLVDADRFLEAERYRAHAGPNLHVRPIALPGRLERGVPVPVGSGATVTLRYAGPVRLSVGDVAAEIDACCLEAEDAGRRGQEWLAQGVGEIALGPMDGPYTRWLTAWRGGEGALLGDIPVELRRAEWPPLPTSAAGEGGLW